MPEDRSGKFFLKPRGKAKIQYICWYNPETRQTDGFSTGTADIEEAQRALCGYVLEQETPSADTDAQLAAVMQTYHVKYGKTLPSKSVHLAAQADALEIWGDPDVSELDRDKQMKFVSDLRERGLSDWTILSKLTRIWAAMKWYKRDNKALIIPEMITAADWKPHLPDNDQTYSIEEFAALFSACGPESPPEQDGRPRYTREHWWRWLTLDIGTAGRVMAVCELKWDQVNFDIGRITLNPPGRRQTKKRRATVPITPTLAAELQSWERDSDYVASYYGRRLKTPEFYDLLAETASVTGAPNVIRHSVRTWLADMGVPDSDADIFMGHKSEGSATGKRYTHRKPEYLKTVAEALEMLYEAIGELLTIRKFKCQKLVPRGKCVADETGEVCNLLNLERETRLELATSTLARLRYAK